MIRGWRAGLMDGMGFVWRFIVVVFGCFGLACLPWAVVQLIEMPHVLLVTAALAVPGYLGAKALERAFRPKLLGGRRPWWR